MRGNLDKLLEIARDIEEKEEKRLAKQAEENLKKNEARLEKQLESSMDRLEEILKSETLYMNKVALNKDRRMAAGSFVIRISENENMSNPVDLFTSRDLHPSVKELGVNILMKTFARSYTFMGFEVFIDGTVFHPDML